MRVDHSSLTDDSTASPWLQAVWRVSAGTVVRGATGVYQQFPTFEQVIGAWGTPDLDPERATSVDVGVEQAIGQSARLQVTVYDREEQDFLRRAGVEPRLVDGRFVPGSRTARYENRVEGSIARHRDDAAAPRRERVLRVGLGTRTAGTAIATR